MEKHLESQPFFVDSRFSVADVSLYAYTHVAHEGGFTLDNFPRVCEWLERVAAEPRHRTMAAFARA